MATLHQPAGVFELAERLSVLHAEDLPDLTIVLADAYLGCVPRNLGRIPGRKILLVADTHHGRAPLQTLISYAQSEPFDGVVLLHDPHHLHWFAEAGIKPLTYLPNVNVQAWPQISETIDRKLVFVGQTGPHHPRRRRMLAALSKAGIPVEILQQSPLEAARTYAEAQISLNCSLNGDLNMRVFEVMAAGGFLVTDRLTAQTGLQGLFREGDHFMAYGNEQELVAVVRRSLDAPEECRRIAQAGRTKYLEDHAPKRRAAELLAFATDGSAPAYGRDLRSSMVAGFGRNLAERVKFYEFVQELHRVMPTVRILAAPEVEARAIADPVDLPDVVMSLCGPAKLLKKHADEFGRLGVGRQVSVGPDSGEPDVLLAHTTSDLRKMIDTHPNAKFVAIFGERASSRPINDKRLSPLGFTRFGDSPGLYHRAT